MNTDKKALENWGRRSCLALVALGLLAVAASGQDEFDEAAMFADTTTVVSDSGLVTNDSTVVTGAFDKKSVGFSGEITSAGLVGIPINWLGDDNSRRAELATFVVGNFMLDVRLINGIKAFGNLETQYVPAESRVVVGLRELFVDANINHRIYLRTGKQVLQWGRCYYFNPTDLINVEKKLFIPKIGYREGAYGLKVHVPFGTVVNLYGFVDTKDALEIRKIAGAGKLEVLLGGTELALSMWGKQGYRPVFAFDMSRRIRHTDIGFEMSMSYGDNYDHIEVVPAAVPNVYLPDDSLALIRTKDKVIPRMAINFSRSVDVNGIPDRLTLISEFYYNHTGYDQNGFDDRKLYRYDASRMDPTLLKMAPPAISQALYIDGTGSYDANNYSKYYMALAAMFSRFITSDFTLQCGALANLQQKSATLNAGLTYTSISDFTASLLLLGYVGKENTEYTRAGQRFAARLTAGLVF